MIVNEEDPVKARLVNDRIDSLLTQANLTIARRIANEGGKFLGLVLNGGEFTVLGQTIQILGLRTRPRFLQPCGRACRRAHCATPLDKCSASPRSPATTWAPAGPCSPG